ncbi:MAG: hypothetical protein ABI867_08890 [Kofleriaceae bacterium]
MADRKATFAKRQRETELKDKAREKEARRQVRRTTPRVNKGPEIAWDEAVRYTESPMTGDLAPAVDPGEDAPIPIPDGPTRRDANGVPIAAAPPPPPPVPGSMRPPITSSNAAAAAASNNSNPNPGAPSSAKPATTPTTTPPRR